MLAIITELSAITAANKSEYGRLAQLVEHLLDVQGVRDSSSLPSTKKPRWKADNGGTSWFSFSKNISAHRIATHKRYSNRATKQYALGSSL